MDEDLAFCLECFADEQIRENLKETEKEVAQLKVEERRVLKRMNRDDSNIQREIDVFCEHARENEKKMVKNQQKIEEELRKILKSMSANLDRLSAASIRQGEDAEVRSFSNRLRHQLEQFDSEVRQLIDVIDQSTSSNYHRRVASWIDEHIDYMKESKKIPKDLLIQYSSERANFWDERATLINGLTERIPLQDSSIRYQLNADLHNRIRNISQLIQHLRSFIDNIHEKDRREDQQRLNEIQGSIAQRRGEHQTRAVALVDALRQLALGSGNAKKFEKKFEEALKTTDDFVPIVLGHIDQPKERNLPLTMRLDGDFQTWSENRSSIQQQFCADLCQALELPSNAIRIKSVEQGSAILCSIVQAPYGKQVLDILSIDQNQRQVPSSTAKYLDRFKNVCIKFKSPLTSIKLGDCGINPKDYLMDVRWNRFDTSEPGHPNATYWKGALDRGGKPYYCPEGWMRFGIKVAENDKAFDARWGSWHIAYHGTSGSCAPLILTSGLKSSVKGCYAIPGRSSVYLSPSIEYSAHPRYARPWEKKQDRRTRWYQLVFQCRVNPRSVGKIRQETLLGDKSKHVMIDKNFQNNEVEWVIPSDRADETFIRDNIVCYGIMIRVCDFDPRELPSSSWWKHVCIGEVEYDSI